MDEYKEPYYRLFNRISETILQLQDAQREAEELFIGKKEREGTVLPLRKRADKPRQT